MAQFVNMRKIDLATGEPAVIALRQLYYADKEANRIGAIVMMNGEPFPLSGTCSGTAIRKDGTTVPMTGTVEGNQAYITLIPDCYAVEGDIQIFVKLTAGDVTATLAAAVGTVRLTETNAVIDPGEIIPSVSALITAINNAVASIPTKYSDLLAAIAPNYADLVYPVAAGTWCWYSGGLYRAAVDIPSAESWTAAHWVNAQLGNALAGDIAALKSALSVESNNANGQIVDVIALNGLHTNGTSNGVTFTWSQDGKTCHASGTSFANSNGMNIMWGQSTIFPPALLNRKPLFYVESTKPEHLYGQVYWYIGGSIQPERINLKNGFTEVEIPSTASGFALRIIADKGQIVYDDDISIKLILGDQSYIPSFGTTIIDMKAAIESVLATFGECHLGPGLFGVSGIDMPEGSMLYGSGDKTIIRLTGSSAGYAVRMANNCAVKDLLIEGSNADITLAETVGNRHGILWLGDYSTSSDKENQPSYGTVSNVFIRRFTGGAITCDNTGPQVNHGLNVCDVSIVNCNAGINIAYYSEFHRFANVNAYLCQYGCVNNGGNNVFVNCGFSNCKVGMICDMVDGSGRSKTNNTHGSAVGCVFNHIDRDDTTLGKGDAVRFISTDNGFVFEGCQFFYGKVYLKDSRAIQFANCLFGPNRNESGTTVGYAITLVNTDATGRKAFFNGCIFSRQPVITIENTGSGTIEQIMNACYTHGGSVVS